VGFSILVKKFEPMKKEYAARYWRFLKPDVWTYQGTFTVPNHIQTPKQLGRIIYLLCGPGYYQIMTWFKHQVKSPTWTPRFKHYTPEFFNGMKIAIYSEDNIRVYRSRIQELRKKKKRHSDQDALESYDEP